MKIGTEIFNATKGFGYLIELFQDDGTGPIANPDLAAYIHAKDKSSQDSIMIRLPEDDASDYSEVVIYKSEGMDEKLKKLLMTIKSIALSYGDTVTIREFGKNIEPKDIAYLPKAKKEMEIKSMNEGLKYAYQDGREFYDSGTGKVIASYPTMVKNDYDEIGAEAAREKFLIDHPDYLMEMSSMNESVDTKISNSKFNMLSDKKAQDINPKDIIKINGATWTVETVARVANTTSFDAIILGLIRKIRGRIVRWSIAVEAPIKEMSGMNEGMPAGVIRDKQKLAQMNDTELAEYLKDKTEYEVLRRQRTHALKNDRYINVWKKHHAIKEDVNQQTNIRPGDYIRTKDCLYPGLVKKVFKQNDTIYVDFLYPDGKLYNCSIDNIEIDSDDVNEDVVPFPSNKEWFSTSSGRIELEIDADDAESCSHSGDCEEDIEALMYKPYIKNQLEKLDPKVVKRELKEYGAWNDDELNDHEMNLVRLLWIACGDIAERGIPVREDVVPFTAHKIKPVIARNRDASISHIEDAKRNMFDKIATVAYKLITKELNKIAPNAVKEQRPLRKHSIYMFLLNDEQFMPLWRKFSDMASPERKEYDYSYYTLVDVVGNMLKEKSGVNVVNEDVVPFKKSSPDEKFGKAWEKQNNDTHRHGLGVIPCKYCDDENCDFECDGAQGDIDQLDEGAKYHRYGTTRSSYHINPKAKKARVIIRHSKKIVDEGKIGARSRNVKSLYVESLNGERRLIETKSLMCARALSNYVNHGGTLFDDTANKIITLSEDIKKIRNIKKKYPLSEDASSVKIHESLNQILSGLTDFLKEMNTSKISTLAEALNLSEPNVTFAKTFYSEKLGEGYDSDALGRGSVLYTRTRKFLPK